MRPDTGRVSLENRVQGVPARMGEEIPHVRGERAGTEGEDGSRSLGQGRGCPALPLRQGEAEGPEGRVRIPENGERRPKKTACPGRTEGSRKEKAEIAYRLASQGYSLKRLLKALGLGKSTYEFHARRFREGSRKDPLKAKIEAVFSGNKGRYGVRRVTAALRRDGERVNHKKVQRIMHRLALNGKTCKKRRPYSSYRGEVGKVAANLLARGFTAEGPDRKFVTDVTEFKLPDGKLYLSPVMDLYSRRIVGYSLSPRPDFAQIRERMENAFGGREGKVRGALFHSDQGWQYQRKEFGDILEGYGMVQSMSRKGNCHDNSVMENFFGRLKVEMFYGEEARYSDYGSLKKALRDYIAWYNSSRLKEYLHWKSPQEALSNSGTL